MKREMKKGEILSGALTFTLLLLLLSGPGLAYAELTPPLPGAPTYIDIDVEKAHEMLAENPEHIILLDIRTEGEYAAEYIPGAVHIPQSSLESRIGELDASKTIIVYCRSGRRSITASKTLAQHDFTVYNMRGGIIEWKEKFATSTSMPAVTPSPAVSPPSTPPTATPIASPVLTPTSEEEEEVEKQVPGFDVTVVSGAVGLIAWCLLWKRRKA
jgi:rhodanese-related sulfurtransferase